MWQAARSAWRLPQGERAHAAEAAAWLVLARAGLRLMRYQSLCERLARLPLPEDSPSLTPGQCRIAIERAARLLPGSTCLARAIAAAAMLARRGQASTLTLAVCVDAARRLDAHAWLEQDGIAIIGADAVERSVLLRTPIGRTS